MPDRPSVLVVDDEPDLVELITAFLEDGYAVSTATTGSEALDMADDSIDIICLDRRMPGIPGDEVVDRLRERGWSGGIVMVSAVDSSEPDPPDWDRYLTKPIRREHLRETIATVLEERAELDAPEPAGEDN